MKRKPLPSHWITAGLSLTALALLIKLAQFGASEFWLGLFIGLMVIGIWWAMSNWWREW